MNARWSPAWMCEMVRALIAVLALTLPAVLTAPAAGQVEVKIDSVNADRPISQIVFQGLSRVTEQEVRNNIRAAVGDPFDPQTVLDDVHRLTRLGQFRYIIALETLQEDGSILVTYRFEEQQIIAEVTVVGNRVIADPDLLAVVSVVPRGPRDDFLIQTAKRKIEDLYRKRGHYLTTVQIDETELNNSGLLIYRVIEGPRVKIRAVEYEGNEAYTDDQLNAQVKTRTALLILRKGELDEELLEDDVTALIKYYTDRGYLDVRVDRRVELSPDNKEAKVTFIVAEGDQYRLRGLRVKTPDGSPPQVFAPEQLAAIIELKTGDVYSGDLLRVSIEAIKQAYGLMGYQDVYGQNAIRTQSLRVPDDKVVDLEITITEGDRVIVGEVHINGNFFTRDNVVRRELRGIHPGLPLDATQIIESENRLVRTRLFSDARITLQEPNPEEPLVRDLLVDVKERRSGSVNFGVALGSDSGLFGEFSVDQRNFDILDFPESINELISGNSFRGAGQQFNFTVRPGTDLFQITTSWTEPRLFDSDYSLTLAAQLRTRFFDLYDEERKGVSASLGRRFGDYWTGSIRTRVEQVELSSISREAPTEIFDDAGPSILTSLGLAVTRTTITNVKRPGSGSRLELSLDQFGAFGGDYTFTSAVADYTVYFTLHEDFMGRKSTLRLNSKVGYILAGDAPTYEQFYLGGRSFRGFAFRTISPKGIRADNGEISDEAVGGEWQFFLGAQYEFPIFDEAVSGVAFVDSGTVTDDIGFDQYRVAVGLGLRIYIPQFGDVPIALDFGIPVMSEEGDDESIFSFSAELPF